MAPMNEQPTHLRVLNVLGLPADAEKMFATLPETQQLGLLISWVAKDVDEIQKHGCQRGEEDRKRLGRIEAFISNVKFGAIVLAGAGALILFLFTVIDFIK